MQIITIFVAEKHTIFFVMQPYTIILDSDFSELWRYNIVVMCSVLCDGEEVEFLKHASEIAPVGAELREIPRGYSVNRRVELRTEEATALTLYIYVMPHTLPMTTDVAEAKPFEMSLEVFHGAEQVYRKRVEVNQWSGENIELHIGDRV